MTDVRRSKVGYLLTESDGHSQCLYSISVRTKFCEHNAKEEKVKEHYSVCLQKPFKGYVKCGAFFKDCFFPLLTTFKFFFI